MLTIEKIIADLKQYCIFPYHEDETDPIITADNFEDYIIYPLQSGNPFGGAIWEYDNGATKVVIIIKDFPYVIKIPIQGDSYLIAKEDFDDDNEEEPYEYGYDYYCGAAESEFFDFDNMCWDYCGLESKVYQVAEKEKIEKGFAKTIKVGDINGYPIYIQEKCITYYDYNENRDNNKENTESIQLAQKISKEKEVWIAPEEWCGDIIDNFGSIYFSALLDFIIKYDINDLRGANLGYSAIDKRPVLIDYCGFNS